MHCNVTDDMHAMLGYLRCFNRVFVDVRERKNYEFLLLLLPTIIFSIRFSSSFFLIFCNWPPVSLVIFHSWFHHSFFFCHINPPLHTTLASFLKIPNLSNVWKNLTFPVNIHLIFIRSDFQSSIYWAYSKWSLVVLTTEDPQNYTNQQSNLFNICKYNGRKQTS